MTQDVPAPEIIVTFPIISDPHNAASVDWKTTRWTLPSNLALCIEANKVSSICFVNLYVGFIGRLLIQLDFVLCFANLYVGCWIAKKTTVFQ